MTDPDFQTWHEKMMLAWHAILWCDPDCASNPIIARAVTMQIERYCRAAGEIEYFTKVMLPFRNMAMEPR